MSIIPTKKQLETIRKKMTVPEMAKHFNMSARKLENLLAKYKIHKFDRRKNHVHVIDETDVPCSNCGYQEGYCNECGKEFCRLSHQDKWESM